ncbi:MAG: GMP/IMP nucleotidase [Candidatus Magnetobacterium sp. LHC-1]|uniref:GMP/IMP nucleotidase n=1 Tax=Candidatus Magnetobacterium casense TaxID=1455061 RepID=A0ABS6RYF7_9BACT|nr:GMP/IMP nucleotidase [Candidatus Magnetobacterium casensis]MBF0607144.1 GMP/IMP nucleotidase [Nitrospirota bacterium]MBV6341365.1 GMP/IMP nucleotidase [Candidatus Magnetobacterium casensis]
MDVVELKTALWGKVEHVLLDMDGTLMDKYFDDYFWGHLVPERYAEKHAMTFGRAKDLLFSKYKSVEGTLDWTDIDFWSEQLHLDIPALKEQIRHLIEAHPHVEDFLMSLRDAGKKVILATNAHYKTIAIKMKKTELGRYFDRVIASFDMGYPKEDARFWINAQKTLGFDKDRTLFIDDTPEVIDSAISYGIRYVLVKNMPNSRGHTPINSPRGGQPYLSIDSFSELLP